MSIRFKFRSAVNFDTVEIENRASISVRELRERILRGKNSQQQQGFDLVFSDAVSGLEYKGDHFQIPSGSSVIVKRVPGGTVHSSLSPIEAVKHVGAKKSSALSADNQPVDEFDDFGADLGPTPDYLENDKTYFMGRERDYATGLRLPSSNLPSVQTNKLPLEMNCSLCNTFFKEAVMIPCCQHSFCEKCIRLVLIEKGRCPKCFSSKCNVKDLLPNLTLRRTIERFLESQMLDTGLEPAMQKYVPDGESGIQAKDVSCALTGDRDVKFTDPSPKFKELDGVRGGNPHRDNMHNFTPPAEFQGENQPVIPQINVHDEADSNIKRKEGFWTDRRGGDRNISAFGGHRKGVRTCYTCGSPDHLMRDCPFSYPNSMFQPGNGAYHGVMPGYAPPYWNGSTFPSFRPFANMYNNPAMMGFNAPMVPVPHFGAPPYMNSMYGGVPGPSRNMEMGNIGAPGRSEYFGLQHYENRRKHSDEIVGREQLSDEEDDSPERYPYSSPEKPHDYKSQKYKEPSLTHSGDSFPQKSGKKTRHDKYGKEHENKRENRPYHSDRSNSGAEDKPRSYDGHKRKGHYDSDSNLSHHSTEKGVKRRAEHDTRDSRKKHRKYSEPSLKTSSHVDRKREYKERDTGHDSRHHEKVHMREKHHRNERWKTGSGSDEDSRDEYRNHHHRKREY